MGGIYRNQLHTDKNKDRHTGRQTQQTPTDIQTNKKIYTRQTHRQFMSDLNCSLRCPSDCPTAEMTAFHRYWSAAGHLAMESSGPPLSTSSGGCPLARQGWSTGRNSLKGQEGFLSRR